MLVVGGPSDQKVNRWPTPQYTPPPPPPPKPEAQDQGATSSSPSSKTAKEGKRTISEQDSESLFSKGVARDALLATLGAGALVAVGSYTPNSDSAGLLGAFMLSSYAGAAAVRDVPPALHSPLMAVTNAISGMTAIGGLALVLSPHGLASGASGAVDGAGVAGGSIVDAISTNAVGGLPPFALGLGALATVVSAINIVGGFRVAASMLSLFQRAGTVLMMALASPREAMI